MITSSDQNNESPLQQTDLNEREELLPSKGYQIYQNIHKLREKLDYQQISEFVKWLTEERGLADNPYIDTYEHALFIILSFSMAILLLFVIRYRYSKGLLLLPFFAFVWMWYQYIDIPRKIEIYYFIGVFIFYVLDRQESLKKQMQYYGQSHYKPNGLFQFSALISIVMISVTIFLTAVFPLDRVNRLTDPIMPNFWGGRSGYASESLKMYTLLDTPYQSKENQLGGPITSIDRDTVLFWVKTDQKLKESLYLKGNVKDYYDGYQWVSHANTYKKAYEFYLSNPQNVKYLESDAPDKISGTIRLDQMNTVTLFKPMGHLDTRLGDKVFVSIDNEAFYKAGAFVKFLSEYKFKATNKDYMLSKDVDYLQLPGNIDNGTYQLSRNLGNYGLTNYEKMVIMTKFLLQNYEYTLYPPEYDKDREFVSKFIFETRKGYCTYFATALTVMARINDIPARYVEGFRVDPGQEGGDGYTAVTEGDAHAWCEVYLEDKGWVVFESTPPYAAEALSLERKSSSELNAMISNVSSTVLTPMPEAVNNFKEGQLEENMILGDDGGNSGNVRPEDPLGPQWQWGQIILITSFSLVAILILSILAMVGLNLSRIKPNGSRSRVLRMIYYCQYLLMALYPDKGVLLDYLLDETVLTAEEKKRVLAILYNGKKPLNPDVINEAAVIISNLIVALESQYKSEFGLLRFCDLKIFKLRKIIR